MMTKTKAKRLSKLRMPAHSSSADLGPSLDEDDGEGSPDNDDLSDGNAEAGMIADHDSEEQPSEDDRDQTDVDASGESDDDEGSGEDMGDGQSHEAHLAECSDEDLLAEIRKRGLTHDLESGDDGAHGGTSSLDAGHDEY